jgi:hypothetical protein
LGRLLGPYEILDDRLSVPVFDYFTDATDPPTLEGLFEAFRNIPNTPELSVHVDDISGGYNETSREIQVSLKYKATRQGQVRLDAGPPTRALGIQLEETVEAEYVAGITMDFVFGVGSEACADGFFMELNNLTADLEIRADEVACGATLEGSSTPLEVENGVVEIDAEVSVQFDDAVAGDGRITLSELQDIVRSEGLEGLIYLTPTGTLLGELPLKEISELDVESKPDPILYLTIKSENVFSETPSVVSLTPNIDSMKDPILDLLKGLSETGETLTNFEPLEVTLPLLNMSIDDLLSGNSNFGLGNTLDFYLPALEYFTLLEIFNFEIDAHLTEIGSLNGIGISDFDIHDENHRLKLKNLLEN